MNFDEDTLMVLAKIAVLRNIIDDLYYEVDELFNDEVSTLYVKDAENKLKELQQYIIKESKKHD